MAKKIKILSGWSAPGGSTVAFINLCNLFNERGYDCTFYGPHEWHTKYCKGKSIHDAPLGEEGETIIAHYLKLPQRPEPSSRVILACHEKEVFPVKDIPRYWDEVAYVSESQMEWHGVSGTVIPNVIADLAPTKNPVLGVAGIIGSVDENKQTHLSILRAVEEDYKKIYLYGKITSKDYYDKEVRPLVDKYSVTLMDHEDNKQNMYDSISKVFHSSLSETFNFVKAECEKTGTLYDGLDTAESGAEYWANTKILKAWEKLLNLS